MLRIGIAGHRLLGDGTTARFVVERCETVLSRARARPGGVVALSALAEGADTLFAEAALRVGVPLELVRPFRRYVDDFPDAGARTRYLALTAAARRERVLPYETRSSRAYLAAMRWIAERSDLLVAVWDGEPQWRRGGTADAVAHARRLGRPVLHLDVVRRTASVRA